MSDFIEILSRLLNVVLLRGNVNESVSARSYRLRNTSTFWKMSYLTVNRIFFWQNNHCRGAHRNRRSEMKNWLESGDD